MARRNQPMGPGDWEGVWVFVLLVVIVVLCLLFLSSYNGGRLA